VPHPAAYQPSVAQLPEAADDQVSLAEVTAFAARHGLGQISPAHLERMRALVEPVARTGRVLQRVTAKERSPALQTARDPVPVSLALTRHSS
jgi:hypothetical protein